MRERNRDGNFHIIDCDASYLTSTTSSADNDNNSDDDDKDFFGGD